MLLGLTAALAAALAFGVAAILQAVAARREPVTPGLDVLLLARLLRQSVYVGALALSLTGFGLHLLALRSLPLFLVQCLIAGSAAVTAVLSAWWLRLPLTRPERRGVVVVCAGLVMLSGAAVDGPTVETTAPQRAFLLAACGALALLGLLAGRLHGARGAAVLGFLAGTGFAVVAVAGRVMPSLAPADLVRDPAAYALVVAGALAFLLYSTALQRGAVMTSTSAMIVSQTALPSVVGVVWLGDSVRPGLGLLALAGFVLAVTGAVTLARHDPLADVTPAPQLRV